jgi:hypothetical protein
MREPMLASHFIDGLWEIIYYGRLNEFVLEHRKKLYNLEEFTSIANIKPNKTGLTDSGQISF